MKHHHLFKQMPLIIWLVAITILLSPTYAEEVYEHIFAEGSHWYSEDYIRARDLLVKQGRSHLPFLEEKTKSKDLNERLFAQILLCHIMTPQALEMWHKRLLSLADNDNVRNGINLNLETEWNKLPTRAVHVPSYYLVDLLRQSPKQGGNYRPEIAAVGLQFYLAPDIEVLDAVIEVVAQDKRLRCLAKPAIVKLGNSALPQMREVLEKTIAMQPSLPWGSTNPGLTQEQREDWDKYMLQTNRALVAAYVVSRLDDRTAIPLMAQCLKGQTTKYRYIEELSEYLSHMKPVEAIDSMLDCTLQSAINRRYKGNSDQPGYAVLRSHLASIGPQILPALKQRLNATQKEGEKIVLENLIAEISDVKGKPKEVAELRESLWFNPTTKKLLTLHELTGEDIFLPLKKLMLSGRWRTRRSATAQVNESTAACLAFAKLKETRAVPLLTEEIRKQHVYLEEMLNQRTTKGDAEAFDPLSAREAGYTFGERDTDIATSLTWGDTCLLALRKIGNDEAKTATAMIMSYPEYATRAMISLLLMKGNIDEIEKHLQSDDPVLREEAALAFQERHDERATHELLCAAARRQGPNHNQWKQYALSSCTDIRPVLHWLADSNSIRE